MSYLDKRFWDSIKIFRTAIVSLAKTLNCLMKELSVFLQKLVNIWRKSMGWVIKSFLHLILKRPPGLQYLFSIRWVLDSRPFWDCIENLKLFTEPSKYENNVWDTTYLSSINQYIIAINSTLGTWTKDFIWRENILKTKILGTNFPVIMRLNFASWEFHILQVWRSDGETGDDFMHNKTFNAARHLL